jgi:hypothetical protein
MIKEIAGQNDVMCSIFADTAATTLPQMMQNEGQSSRSHSVEEQIVERFEPEQVFGEEVVDKWAALAFQPIKSSFIQSPSNLLSKVELDQPAIKR